MKHRILYYLAFLLVSLIPLSCTAQQNALSRISSVERSDGQGHVIRFHLASSPASFDFSQPQNHLVQFELKSNAVDTSAIRIDDRSGIIEKIDFYTIPGGIGADIHLREGNFYIADAYPDRNKKDVLLALTKTTQQQLARHILDMEPFAWSGAEQNNVTPKKNVDYSSAAIDTTYQRIKEKIKFDVVVLDAGHGGRDVGTIGHNRTYEKNVVLAITKKVGGYIEKYLPDVKVVYTRDADFLVGDKKDPDISIRESLIERGRIANRAEGDLFVSIHANAASAKQAHGTETYFLGLERSQSALEVMKRENNIVGASNGNSEKQLSQEDLIIYELANSGYIANSERLAAMIEQQFKNRAGRRSRGVKQARFMVLYHASMPAVLVETGFVSNPNEQQFLSSDYGQSIIASAIFRAIRDYKEQFERSQHFNTN